MDANVFAFCGWVQQGDGYQFGEPRSGWAAPVSRYEQVSVRVAGALSVDRETTSVHGEIQYADCYVTSRQDCRIIRIYKINLVHPANLVHPVQNLCNKLDTQSH